VVGDAIVLAPEALLGTRSGRRKRLAAGGVNLSAIASVGSAVSLIVFVLVGAAGYRRRADTGSNTALVVLAIALTAIVLAFFMVDIVRNDPGTFGAIVGIAIASVLLDAGFS
jgi:hypothetical protein